MGINNGGPKWKQTIIGNKKGRQERDTNMEHNRWNQEWEAKVGNNNGKQ